MTGNLKDGLVVAVFAAIMLAGYIRLFFKRTTGKEKFIEKAKSAGHYTAGTIRKSKRSYGNDDSNNSYFRNDRIKVTYGYKVNGKEYQKRLLFQSPGCVSIDYPYEITVYFDPKNPAKAVCKEEISADRSGGCLGTFLLDLIFCALLYHLLKIF